MTHLLRDTLLRQFDLSWALTEYHLNSLTTEECLWRPASEGLHVWQQGEQWRADWPEHEGYDLGPSSIAWITWHMLFWWSSVLSHSFGDGQCTREQVLWPGSAELVVQRINELRADFRRKLEAMTDEELQSSERTRWPFTDKPFGDVVAWLNVELAKNAAELGYARFAYAVRPR